MPRRLVGRATPRGPVPSRVAPIFRDREEFSAAGDLTAEVRAALAASGALIVVCSPNAAGSPWVGREVELFRELHPDRPVLAALVAGEPAEAFPLSLTRAGGAPVEPLAADFRSLGDGPRLALLKLVAGVLGLGLDELVQRDAQQRLRAVTAITAGAVAVALVMSALTVFALLARADAQRQRGKAEALVEFMLTDLRDKLKGVGRLDVLTAANAETLTYYDGQDIDLLPPASRARYARILLAMGEDDLTHGDQGPALDKFRKADRTTSALLAEKPDDPERIWAQGQSEYWLGYVAYLRGDRKAAGDRWGRYRALAQRLAEREPANPKYRKELAYAEGNLCTLALKATTDPKGALKPCAASLAEMEATAELSPSSPTLQRDLANRHGWMAEAEKGVSDNDAAMRQREAEGAILDALMRAEPKAMDLKERWIAMQRSLSGLDYRAGRWAESRSRLLRAEAILDQMIAFEPANADWRTQKARIDDNLAFIARHTRQTSGDEK